MIHRVLAPALLLVGWRRTVAFCGLLGVVLAAQVYDVWWTALSQLADLAVAGTYAALAVLAAAGRDTGRSWLPGALAATMCLGALAYLAWYVSADLAVYDVLDPARPLVMTGQVVLLGVVLVGCGYALVALGRHPDRHPDRRPGRRTVAA